MAGHSSTRGSWKWVVGWAIILVVILVVPSRIVYSADPGDTAKTHNELGVEHFNTAFYEHTPKGKVKDAEAEFDRATVEFRNAIQKDPSFVEPHRNLARLSYIQKRFAQAAKEYEEVTKLDSFDLDAYVNLALARIELGDFTAAIDALEQAKVHTSDEHARGRLNDYIAKVRSLQ